MVYNGYGMETDITVVTVIPETIISAQYNMLTFIIVYYCIMPYLMQAIIKSLIFSCYFVL